MAVGTVLVVTLISSSETVLGTSCSALGCAFPIPSPVCARYAAKALYGSAIASYAACTVVFTSSRGIVTRKQYVVVL